MATEIHAGPLGEVRAASTAGGGTALTTTLTTIALPSGTHYASITPRNFASANVVKIIVNPYLIVLKTTDGGATATNLTDYSENAQDGSASTSVDLSALDTLANGDALYVGSWLPFRGVNITVDGTNTNASTLTVKYWKSDSTWADSSDTDATQAPAGDTLGQSGTVTWSIPSDWATTDLVTSTDMASAHSPHVATPDMYWTRWEVSAALDAAVTLDHFHALNRSTAYAELLSGQNFEETVSRGPKGLAVVEALTDAGTANLIVNIASRTATGRFA